MKAPEKIYLYPSDLAGIDYEEEWGEYPWGKESVEYTRTDTIIEKACEWLESVNLDFYQIREGVFSRQLVEDFKNYIKGE